MSYVRCSHCAARRTLPKKIADYVRLPACRTCGHRKYRVDKYRVKHERAPHAKPCMCHLRPLGGSQVYSWPHRKGSLYCAENPGLTVEMLQAWAHDRGLA